MDIFQESGRVILIGMGATAVMDVWLVVLQRMGVSTQSFALIGRWVGHLLHGRVHHPAISKAEPIAGELAWGWLTHYLVGVAFAAVLVLSAGPSWMASPTLVPALVVGACTVAAPWLLMQPAMGAGFFASKTPAPLTNCVRNLANHGVFGAGLYLSAALLARLTA